MLRHIKTAFLAFAAAFALFSCDDDDPVKQLDQLFRPVIKSYSVGGGSISLAWSPIKDAYFVIELSTASDFSSPIIHEVVGEGEYVIHDLRGGTPYYIRIKSVSLDGSMKDSEYNTVANPQTPSTENVFYSAVTEDIGIDYITLAWDTARIVTHITLTTPDNETPVRYALSATELFNGTKLFEGLDANTEHTFRIYNGDEWLRGTATRTTLEENIFGPVIMDNVTTNQVALTWDNKKPADRIVASASGHEDISVSLLAAETGKTITGLSPETDYTFTLYTGTKVRGTVVVRTKTANLGDIFITPAAEDITDTSITLKWNTAAFDVTHILVSTLGGEDRTITLPEEDINSHQTAIEGLTSATEYNFRIYYGTSLRGELIVRTD